MIKKKLLSLMTIIAIISTMMSTVVVNAAADVALSVNVTDTSTVLDDTLDVNYEYESYWGNPVYTVKLSISGLSKKTAVKDEGGIIIRDEDNKVCFTGVIAGTIQAFITYDTDKFIVVKKVAGTGTPSAVVGDDTAHNQLTYAWTNYPATLDADGVIATWYLVSKEAGKVIDQVTFDVSTVTDETFVTADIYDTTNAAESTKMSYNKSAIKFNKFVLNKPTVDFTALDEAIAAFGTKTEADYTTDSWAAAKAAYDAAVAVKGTATTQAEVDAATTALNNAIAALVEKPVDKVTVTPDERSEKKDNESGLWTYGFSGTVTKTGSASYSRLIFNFKDGDKEGKEPYIWEVGTSLNTSITYGLNIWGCPVGSDVTATVTAE